MHQSFAIERRTCKHLKALRGEEEERLRVGGPIARGAVASSSSSSSKKVASASGVTAPPLLLAHTWENDVDLTDWWMSEKLDGVRAYWDGTQFLSRLGNKFWAPDWFIEKLPADMPLDGELFGGRKKFQRTVSIVRRQDQGAGWREISFLVFDAPSHGGPFEDRLKAVSTFLDGQTATLEHVRAHPHERCRGLDHVREELARVEALGGEGLMLRKPGSHYESGRSSSLLKVKTFHDAEAVVVAHLPGAGRHKGRVGALECGLPDGTRFSVGTGLSDAERESPPPIGSVITFRYQELSTDGVPRFPSYVGVRAD
jgi:DNA ligase-1